MTRSINILNSTHFFKISCTNYFHFRQIPLLPELIYRLILYKTALFVLTFLMPSLSAEPKVVMRVFLYICPTHFYKVGQ